MSKRTYESVLFMVILINLYKQRRLSYEVTKYHFREIVATHIFNSDTMYKYLNKVYAFEGSASWPLTIKAYL